MKIKNYEWNGFGFPIFFEELPAVKSRGELVPDVDWFVLSKPVAEHVCSEQHVPLSGNQVKFLRNLLDMSLREFAKFISVKHQSVMRWESRAKSAAHIDPHLEVVLRIKVLKAMRSRASIVNLAVARVDEIEELRTLSYRTFEPLILSKKFISEFLRSA